MDYDGSGRGLRTVRAFAGDDFEIAVVPEKARTLLKRFDARSQHYQDVHSATSI
jgi:hypothetical protein